MDTVRVRCLFFVTVICQLLLSNISPATSAEQSVFFVHEPPDFVDFSNSTGTRIPCAATGSPLPTITWLVADGNQVTNVTSLRQVNTDGTLVFPPFRAEDYRQDVHAVVYKCVASNVIGTIISRDVNVRAVVLQPYDVYVYDVYVIKGNTAVFRCHVPSFLVDYVKVTSWVRDSAFVIQSSFAEDGKYIVMPTGELYVRDVGANDAMTTFRCQTQHRLTSEVKMSATSGRLFVTEPQGKVQPRVTDSKTSIKANQHDTVVLPCIAQGHPVPAPKWFTKVANGHLLPVYVGDRIHQPNGALVIRDAQVTDTGTYVCVISNNASSERIETSVAITAPLTVEVQPTMLLGELGKAATFRCHVSSFPISSLYWLKDGRPLPMPGLQLPTTETVLIEAVRLTDRGMFQCMAKRGYESAQGTAELKIGDITPAFRAVFEERVLQPGPSLTLQCVTYGSPKPQVTWKLDGMTLPEANERASVRDHVDAGGNVVSRLTVSKVKPEDGGVYRCVSNNLAGSIEHMTRINIYGRPGVRARPKMTAVAGDNVMLTCPMFGYPIDMITWEKDGVILPINLRQTVLPNGTLVIEKIQRATDSGKYTCFVQNKQGQSARGDVEVIVMVPPKITPFSFQEELLREGMRARLQCVVSEGDLPLTIKWLKDGRAIPVELGVVVRELDDVSSILAIASVAPRHNGNYTCVATNDAASASHTAALFVNVRPKIIPFAFLDDHFYKGMRAHITCAVSQGDLPIAFGWSKDGWEIPPSLGVITRSYDQHASSLTIENVGSEHTGNFTCVATNAAATVQYTASLLVHVAPKIIPFSFQDEHLFEGVLARISCVVYQGDLPLTIEWMKDGRPISSDLGLTRRDIDDYSSILTFEKVQTSHNGNYTCVVSNDAATVNYSAQLTVYVPPKIVPFSFQDEHLFEGMLVRVSCVISRGDLPLSITWQKDTSPIRQVPGIMVRAFDEYSSILSIDPVLPHHSGNYTCIAHNAAGSATFTTQLLVNVPPRWLIEPVDSTAVRGETAMLHCKADGFPPPEISWMKAAGTSPNAERKPILSNYDVEVLYNGTLLVRQTEQSSDGFYFCRAANGVGEGLSKVVRLFIHVPTHFNVRFHNHSSHRGEDVRLKCEAYGDLPIAVTWRFGGESIDQRVDPRYKITETTSEDGVYSEFMIHNTERRDTGMYSCLGANKYGSDEIKLQLVVQEPPDPPKITKLESVGNRSVHLIWSEPFDGNSILLRYIIQYKPKAASWDNEATSPNITIDGNKMKAIARNLFPATTYHFRIFSENAVGTSISSDIGTVDIEEEPPGNPPRQVDVEASDPQTLRVTWKPPEKDPWTGNIRGYYIGFKIYNSTDPYNYHSIEVPDDYAEDLVFRLTDLRMYSQYSIIVQAYNDRGRGPNSPEILVMTSEDIPTASPTDVACAALTSQSINVNWQLLSPHAVNGILRGYRVLFKPADEWYGGYGTSNHNVTIISNTAVSVKTTESNKVTLRNLDKSVNYSIQVLAYTRVGDGPKSDPVYCKTHEDVPGPPVEIKVIPTSLDSVLVAWKPPSRPNGVIIRYNVYIRDAADSPNTLGSDNNLNRDSTPKSEEFLDATKFTQSGDSTTYEIKGLKKNRRYEFWVTAATAVGEGQSTRVVAQSPVGPLVGATAASFNDVITSPWKREIRFPCFAVGMPLPQRKWISRGRPVRTTRKVRILADGTLVLKDIDHSDAGNYTCVVQNKIGEDKITYTLIVQVPPSRSTLTVVSTSLTTIELQWKPEPEESTPVSGYILHYKREFGQWETIDLKAEQTRWRLENLWCGTKYFVYVQGYNKIGVGATSEILTSTTEGSVPEAPNKETLLKGGSSFVTITLEGWPLTGCPIMYFVVEYKRLHQIEWTLVSNNAKPEQRKMVVPGLQPGTWYTLRVTAHSSAGSAVAEHNFATLTFDGGTVGPEVMIQVHEEKGVLFYLDLRVIIPIALSLVILFVALLIMCIYFRRRNCDDRLIKGRVINGIVKSSSKFSSSSSTGKNYSVDSFGNGQSCNESIARRYPSISDKLTKGSSEEITPYATTQLPNFHYGEMKTFGERKSGAGSLTGGAGSDSEDTQKRCKKGVCDGSRPKSDGAVIAAYPRPEPDGKAAWATGQPERSFSSRTTIPVGQSRSAGRTPDSTGRMNSGGASPRQQASPGDTKWRIVQRNLGNISKAKVHGVGSGSNTQETTFIFPKTPDEGGITTTMQSDVSESDRYDEPIPPPSAFQSKPDGQSDVTENVKLLKRAVVSSKNK